MESQNNNIEEVEIMGGTNGIPASSRWNPTKEQISMLENLYKQGIKTPTAEEIQQITARLRAYGHIEGKNVFYWFQNHKARQRQKQKQDNIAYFNRFLHRPQPFFSPSPICPPNVLCTPYCIPQGQSEMGFYPQHPAVPATKVLLPVGYRRSHVQAAEKVNVVPNGGITSSSTMICNGPVVYEGMQQQQQQQQQKQKQRISECNLSYSNQETLDLFPLHPTGILQGKTTTDHQIQESSVSADSSTDTRSASPDDDDINIEEDGFPQNQPFFDFFNSGQGS